MDMLEKVEKLRAKANVSYEDAKAALEEANGDILDAMIILEKQGKAQAPKNESYSTRYEDQSNYPVVLDEQPKKDKTEKKYDGRDFKDKLKDLWKKSCENYFVVERNGNIIIDIPIWVFVLILLFTWHTVWLIILISLFFGCHYSFQGPANMDIVNDASSKVSDAAESIKNEFSNRKNN